MENKQLSLVKGPCLYKMKISPKVEYKIRTLCSYIPNIEWSGVLFYTVSGSFSDGDLEIECIDIFQMDEGTSAYTCFSTSPDLAAYIVNNPELLEEGVHQGLIHSHNQMSTFFSGTDLSTLKSEGADMPNFVSLIVNNAGTYSAAVTRVIHSTQNIQSENKCSSWGKEDIENKVSENKETFLEYYELHVINSEHDLDVMQRVLEVRNLKRVGVNKGSEEKRINPVIQEKPLPKYSKPVSPFDNTMGGVVTDKLVNGLVYQLITTSVLLNGDSKVDLGKWGKSMDKMYSKRFQSIEDFEYWASNMIDYILDVPEPDFYEHSLNKSGLRNTLASALIKALKKLPANKYIDTYIELLSQEIY